VQVSEKGLTLVPLRLYFKDGRAKIELGRRRKKLHDKRAPCAEREFARDDKRPAPADAGVVVLYL